MQFFENQRILNSLDDVDQHTHSMDYQQLAPAHLMLVEASQSIANGTCGSVQELTQ